MHDNMLSSWTKNQYDLSKKIALESMKFPPFLLQSVLSWLRAHCNRLAVLFFGVLLPLSLFGMVAEEVSEQEKFFIDHYLLIFMYSHASAPLDRMMMFFSWLGSGLWITTVGIAVAAMLVIQRRWGALLFWSLAVSGAALLNMAAKQIFGRARPELWLSIAPETTLSFPSGHAMQSMALAASVVILCWHGHWRWLTLILGSIFVVLVGISRVYLGVHYPTDILAGWLASLAWVIGLATLFDRHLMFRRTQL
jgi:membrane-associated phospholipid phosphatase